MKTLKTTIRFLEARTATTALLFALSLAASGTLTAQCTGPGAPVNTDTRCVTAIPIPGEELRSFDISWADPHRALYFLGDRSNQGVDIVSTDSNTFIGRATGFVGLVFNANGTVNNNKSGPDGVVSHGRWLYAGDGDSTLKIFDISDPTSPHMAASISTGGSTRLDEMALSTDGRLLLAVNNAEDPPFATLFTANGDDESNSVTAIAKITVDNSILPATFGLSIEQPAWVEEHDKGADNSSQDQETGLFYASIPIIANNPTGCNYGQLSGPNSCSGGLLIINPADLDDVKVVPLNECGPNGLTVGPESNLLEGCTPGNDPTNTSQLVINANTFHYANIGGITGSDEVWFNGGDKRYYTASSRQIGGPVLGVINAITNLLIETVPQSSGAHSIAADSKRNFIYVPQVAPASVVGTGGDTTTVGAGICGSMNGCIAVYTDTAKTERRKEGSD